MACPPVVLSDFLDRMAEEPFAEGSTDCVMTVADWVVLNGHPDPAAPFRGRYRTALGLARLLRREGGLESIMTAGALRSGLPPTDHPTEGDVGLVRIAGQEQAAICLGELWAAKGRGVVAAVPEHIIKAWRV